MWKTQIALLENILSTLRFFLGIKSAKLSCKHDDEETATPLELQNDAKIVNSIQNSRFLIFNILTIND